MSYKVQYGGMRGGKSECVRMLQEMGCSLDKASDAVNGAWYEISTIQKDTSEQDKEVRKAIRSLYRRK